MIFLSLYESASKVILEGIEDEFATIQQRGGISREKAEKLARDAGMGYWKWVLAKWAKEQVRLPEDSHRIKEALKAFEKNKSKLAQKDINQYKTVSEVEQAVEGFVDSSEKKVAKKVHSWEGMPGVRVVQTKGPYTTLEITDAESLKKLGEGTKWCTRGSYPNCAAEDYLQDYGKIFTVFESGRPVMQYTPDYVQVMDINDNAVKDPTLLKLIPKPDVNDTQDVYNYAHFVIKGRWPEGESAIAKGAVNAYYYARNVIKGRFPEGEPAIAKDAEAAYYYAENVIKGRFPEGEPAIAKDGWFSKKYLKFLHSIGQTPAHPELFKGVIQ